MKLISIPILVTTALCSIFAFTSIQAYNSPVELGLELDISNSYRRDCQSSSITCRGIFGDTIGKETIKTENLTYYQVGVIGRWDIRQWLFRFDADYAWSTDGDYHDHNKLDYFTYKTRAKVNKGTAQDLTLGAGYFFCLPQLIGLDIAPVGGWSYHQQEYRIHHASTNGISNPYFDGIDHTNRWEGPWVGLDTQFCFEPFSVYAGYEYHWGTWHAKWKLSGPDVQPPHLSDERKSKHAIGQVIYLDGRWEFWCNYMLGLGVKYQHWHASHGSEKPLAKLFQPLIYPNLRKKKVKEVTWSSLVVSIDIGYSF